MAKALLLYENGSLAEVALYVGSANAVILANPDRSELPRLDEPVYGHVGDTHDLGYLADGEQRLTEETIGHFIPF
jgi:hypothetical protein